MLMVEYSISHIAERLFLRIDNLQLKLLNIQCMLQVFATHSFERKMSSSLHYDIYRCQN